MSICSSLEFQLASAFNKQHAFIKYIDEWNKQGNEKKWNNIDCMIQMYISTASSLPFNFT